MTTFLYSKQPTQDIDIQQDFTGLLNVGETLNSISVLSIYPATATPLTISQFSAPNSALFKATVTGGIDETAYGVKLQVVTTVRQFIIQCVVNVQSNSLPYPTDTGNNAYNDLIESLKAGSSAVGVAIFTLPFGADASKGNVTWTLLDNSGLVYSSGTAFEYSVRTDSQTAVMAKCLVNAPDTIPPSGYETQYQIQYKLTLPDVKVTTVVDVSAVTTTSTTTTSSSTTDTLFAPQTIFYTYENVTISGDSTIPTGPQSLVELWGDTAAATNVLDKAYDTVTLEVYYGNTLVYAIAVNDVNRVASGTLYTAPISTSNLVPSLVPYTLSWKYTDSVSRTGTIRESASLYVITPSILQVMEDMQAKLMKARTSIYGASDILYPPETLLTWLRRGADRFNGSHGIFTNFTFTNALGSIREFWMMFAELAAIEAQYLAEGEKAFNFSGAAIQLEVDKTQYLDNAASKIQSILDNEVKPFKTNLVLRGVTGGDGSSDPTLLQAPVAAVSIAVTPASIVPTMYPSWAGWN